MATPAVHGPAAAASARPRMYHVDLLRVGTFTCVVFVHAYGAMNPGDTVDMGATSLIMHFTRYSFVFITAFVLFFGYYHKDVGATAFWRRRFGAVVAPYVVWTLLYTVLGFTVVLPDSPGDGALTAAANLLQGTGWFHLYFLLVSMQLYLVFPALRWLVRRTTGHHGTLLLAAAALQLGMLVLFSAVDPPPGDFVLGKLWELKSTILPTYALFAVLGALAAVHVERVRAFVMAPWRRPLFYVALSGGLVATLAWYLLRVNAGVPPQIAASPTHPDLLPWALGCVLGMYAVCTWWAARRRPGSPLATAVDWGSVRAFGVYAVHPLIIDLQWRPWQQQFLELFGNRVCAGLAMFVSTMVLSLAVVELMLRSPLARVLVARSPLPLRRGALTVSPSGRPAR